MAVTYPTNANDPTLSVNNLTDHRDLTSPNYDSTGEPSISNPTQTLNDLFNPFTSLGILETLKTEINNYESAVQVATLSATELSYFTKMKELRLLMLTELARKMAFELKRLTAEVVQADLDITTALVNSLPARYPSSNNSF